MVRERLAAYAAFAPSRRLAEALSRRRSGRRAAVASTRPTRRAGCSRSGRTSASAAPATSAPIVERAARGGRLEPGRAAGRRRRRSSRPAGSPMGCASSRAPLLHDLYRVDRRRCPALRVRLEASDRPGGRDRSTRPRPQLGGLRRGVRIAYERLRARLDSLVHSELAGALQEPIVTLRNGPLRRARPRRRPGRVRGHRPRPVGQRPDALRRAAHRGRPRERLARGAAGRDRPRRSASSTSSRPTSGASATASAPTSRRSRASTYWMCRARLAEEMDAIRPCRVARRRGRRCCRRATRASPGDGRARSTSGSAASTRRSSSPAPTPAARPSRCGPSACSRSCTRRGSTCPRRPAARCRSSATSSPTSATSSRWRSRSRRSAATCGRSSRIVEAAGAGTPRAPRRARRGHGPDGGLGARPGAPRPLHPRRRARHRDDPLRRAQDVRATTTPQGAQRLGRVRPRDARADVPPLDRPAGHEPGVRHRRAARPARPSWSRMPARGSPSAQQEFESTLASIREASARRSASPRRARARRSGSAAAALEEAEDERRRARAERHAVARRRRVARPTWRSARSRPRSPSCAARWPARR